ncbi:hypothetical protein ACXR0O_28525 [Verrucomicrobiota bacterium sgz303538]
MIYNEGLYTNLTWSQLLIGLIMGLTAVFVINAMERMRRKRQAARAKAQTLTAYLSPKPGIRPAKKEADLPVIVTSIIRAAYYTLRVLASSRKPVFLGSIVRRIHDAQKAHKDPELLTPVAIRASIDRLVSHGSIRLGRRGISITDSGMELFTRVVRINERLAPVRGQGSSAVRSVESFRTRPVVRKTATNSA